jgi:beta-galactosidase
VTTNFMVTGHIKHQDYWRWAAELDVVANDHYLDGSLPDPHIELAFCADATRGMAGGEPWLLMEHSTSAVNWQPRNIAKQPGEMRRNSMQHVARGADAVLFFQWRASRAGAEKYHSGLLPHGGTETRLWREVVQLGQDLDRLAEVAGSVVPTARVALLHDYPRGGAPSWTRTRPPTCSTSTSRSRTTASSGDAGSTSTSSRWTTR